MVACAMHMRTQSPHYVLIHSYTPDNNAYSKATELSLTSLTLSLKKEGCPSLRPSSLERVWALVIKTYLGFLIIYVILYTYPSRIAKHRLHNHVTLAYDTSKWSCQSLKCCNSNGFMVILDVNILGDILYYL